MGTLKTTNKSFWGTQFWEHICDTRHPQASISKASGHQFGEKSGKVETVIPCEGASKSSLRRYLFVVLFTIFYGGPFWSSLFLICSSIQVSILARVGAFRSQYWLNMGHHVGIISTIMFKASETQTKIKSNVNSRQCTFGTLRGKGANMGYPMDLYGWEG